MHKKLRHINAWATVQIADSLGWIITGNRTISCASCATGIAKQKSLNSLIQMIKKLVQGLLGYIDSQESKQHALATKSDLANHSTRY